MGNLLLDFSAFTLRTLEVLLFIFRDGYGQGEQMIAFSTQKIVIRHFEPPAYSLKNFQYLRSHSEEIFAMKLQVLL